MDMFFDIHCKDICISFIVKSVIESFAMIYTLVFNGALKKTSHACLGDHESYFEDITNIIKKLCYIYVYHITRFIFEVNQINIS